MEHLKLNVYMKNVFHSCTTYNSLWVDRMNASRWFSCSGGFASIAVLFISFYFCVVFYFCSFQPCIMGFKSIHRSAHTFVICDAKRELCKYNPKWCTNCPRTRSTYTMHNIRGFNGKNETISPTHHKHKYTHTHCMHIPQRTSRLSKVGDKETAPKPFVFGESVSKEAIHTWWNHRAVVLLIRVGHNVCGVRAYIKTAPTLVRI